MKTADVVAFAASALAGHRLRTALSVLGMAVGISAVVALTALGEGAREYVVAEFMSLGTNLLIVLPGRVETTGMMPFGGTVHDLTIADFEAVATRVPGVRHAAPIASGTETVRYGGKSRAAPIFGSTSELAEVRHLEVAAGRFLSPGDPDRGSTEVVLGSVAARELFGAASPLGEVVRIGQWRFRVVGVVAPHGRSLGFDFDELVVVPVATAMQMFNKTTLFRILVELDGGADLERGKAAVLALLADRHRSDDVTVVTQDAMVATFSAIFNALTLALVGIASVSLTVAGVGIMNVMLVAVAERRREIGLIKALGAGRGQIVALFLTEAAILASIGGACGVAAGWAAVRAFVAVYPAFPAAAPAWAVAASLAVSTVVGLAFGVLPARRAALLDPVQALVGR